MDLHSGMKEVDFIKALHEGFVFDNEEEYQQAARVACSISDNAALMVGYELASGASYASAETNSGILDILKTERSTPVVLAAIPVIESLLDLEPVPRDRTRRLLDACREHGNAWSGLGIVLCADPGLEQECDRIMTEWRKAAGIPADN
jgi:hypothetical protein